MSARRRAVACVLSVLALAPRARAQEAAEPPSEELAVSVAPVELDGGVLFSLRGARSFPAERRAAEVAARIRELALGRQYTTANTMLYYVDPLGVGAAPSNSWMVYLTGQRYDNAVSYTGNFGPVSLIAEYALGETAGNTRAMSSMSFGVKYAAGPITTVGDFQQTRDSQSRTANIYLAGLKGVDATLREAAAVDGASEVKTFFHVVFPVMRPINMIVIVIVVIEALRAFDIVWVVNKGRNGLELIGALVAQNVIGEATRYGFGSALAVIMMLISSIFITVYLRTVFREERRS